MTHLFKPIQGALIALLALQSLTAAAAVALPEVQKWKNVGDKNQAYEYSDAMPEDSVVAENARYVVIFQGAGNSCAAGNFYLADKQAKTYRAVDAKNCDDRQFTVDLQAERLQFKKKGKVTAQYPLAK